MYVDSEGREPALVEPLVEQFDSVWRNAPAAKPSGSPTSAARSFRVAKVARGCATFAANVGDVNSAAIQRYSFSLWVLFKKEL